MIKTKTFLATGKLPVETENTEELMTLRSKVILSLGSAKEIKNAVFRIVCAIEGVKPLHGQFESLVRHMGITRMAEAERLMTAFLTAEKNRQ